MKMRFFWLLSTIIIVISAIAAQAAGPLPAWNDTMSKRAIIAFVEKVTIPGSPDYVPPAERIAVFDNDGTLWSEQPLYFQFYFAIDRVKELSANHPEWKTQHPFQAVLEGDMKALATSGKKGLVELIMATHAGMTTDEFAGIVSDWVQTARHPALNRPYTSLVFQPMLELLDYLRAKFFKTYIVSGGGIEFMRPWTETVYGIPPEQVVGSSIVTKFEMRDGKPVLVREPKVHFIDDKEGKPVGINSTHRPPSHSPPSATPTATCRCCNGPWPGKVLDSPCWSTTRMASASGPMIANRTSAAWTRPSMKPGQKAGP